MYRLYCRLNNILKTKKRSSLGERRKGCFLGRRL